MRFFSYFLWFFSAFFLTPIIFAEPNTTKKFDKILIILFENMSYSEIKNEPAFKKLVAYTGNQLDENGRLIRLKNARITHDQSGNGYAFLSSYYNNHSGGTTPSRTSQPNYIAMTSGGTHGIIDNDTHDLNVDNLASELHDAGLTWKVYADDLPDPTDSLASSLPTAISSTLHLHPNIIIADPNKSEEENDRAAENYYSSQHLTLKSLASSENNWRNGCFVGASFVDGNRLPDDGYKRKHEPFISYMNIQNSHDNCKNIINSKQLANDLTNHTLPTVALYIPNQINDGHNGSLSECIQHANTFLSKMLGLNSVTGEPLPNANDAPFQQFMAQGGLLMITFDEPSTANDPDQTLYSLLAGKMINSGAYPNTLGKHLPICYPPINSQTTYPQDVNGAYMPTHCNHYNLLKMIEANFQLRGIDGANTATGYKYAMSLDETVPELWRA